jgi:hypothetical protein
MLPAPWWFPTLPFSPSLTLRLDEQIFGDTEAADIVFTSGADVVAVGINVTHQVVLTGTFWKIGVTLLIIFCCMN